MLIVSLLSDTSWKALMSASPRSAVHHRVNSVDVLLAEADMPSQYLAAIIDPELVTESLANSVVAHFTQIGIPIILLGVLNAQTVNTCLMVEIVRPINALLSKIDVVRSLRLLLQSPDELEVSTLLLHRFARAITGLPPSLRNATVALFTGHPIPSSTSTFSEWTGVDRRTSQRWYKRIQLAGMAHLLTIARLARAWRLMQSDRLSHSRIAMLTGFGSTRTLSRGCRRLAGCGPTEVRTYTAVEFANRLVRGLSAATASTELRDETSVIPGLSGGAAPELFRFAER